MSIIKSKNLNKSINKFTKKKIKNKKKKLQNEILLKTNNVNNSNEKINLNKKKNIKENNKIHNSKQIIEKSNKVIEISSKKSKKKKKLQKKIHKNEIIKEGTKKNQEELQEKTDKNDVKKLNKKRQIDNEGEENEGIEKKSKKIPHVGFNWNVSLADLNSLKPNVEEDSEDDDDEEDESKKVRPKLTKAEKLAAAKEAEAKIRQAEEQLLQDGEPVSPDQFDRMLLAQPNNSELWVKYMAYHLQATEIEKSRAVARRALTVINIRNEEDRLNVWTSLLNLEHLYGTPESLQECLSEAVRCNDDVKVYSKMAEIYAAAGQIKELELTVKTLIKKTGQNHSSLDTWLKCANLLLKIGQKDSARHLLQRGLNSLPATLHLQFISRFALLENTHGDPERAQALFEHTLTTYPTRVDVWGVYVDMLVKSKRVDLARQVIQRAVTQKLPPKKLKPLYKKWLQLEEQYGDAESVVTVKKEIEEYVHNISEKLR